MDLWRDILWFRRQNRIAQGALAVSAAAALALVFALGLQGPAFMILGALAFAAARSRGKALGPRALWTEAADREDAGRRKAEQERRRALAGPDGVTPLTELVTAEALSHRPPSGGLVGDPLGALLSAQESCRRALDGPGAAPPLAPADRDLSPGGAPPRSPPSPPSPARPLRPASETLARPIVETPRRWVRRRRAPPGSIVQ